MQVLKKLYSFLIKSYDSITSSYATISIGDIFLERSEIEHNQFLAASRLVDIENFIRDNDCSFDCQNTVVSNRAIEIEEALINKYKINRDSEDFCFAHNCMERNF